MKRKISLTIVFAALAALCFIPSLLGDDQPKIKRVSAHATASVDGQDLFREYCAVCHGNDAKGTGPAAAALKVKPADLTLISQKNGSKFPEIRVQRVINGEDEVLAHGSHDMPVGADLPPHECQRGPGRSAHL